MSTDSAPPGSLTSESNPIPGVAEPEPIARLTFETGLLMVEHPPVWRDRNKQVVFDIAVRAGDTHAGTVEYTRWRAMPLPASVDLAGVGDLVLARHGYFDYEAILGDSGAGEWHVNFADPHLFVAYGSSLFAQDEMQVVEHPALGALKEALVADGRSAVTVDHGAPTPILVMGVERRCRISTDPDAAAGRPHGLYGNAFARVSRDGVSRATMRIEPPTMTNFIAIAAPSGGHGRYRRDQIETILVTAFTGFRASVGESRRARSGPGPVVVHSGYWGCGAFGGNRVLMALLQVLAARMAGLDRLVFHTGTPGGDEPLAEALRLLADQLASASGVSTAALIDQVEVMAFEWGLSDGN